MKIPNKVKIGGHWFKVEYKSDDEDGYEQAGTRFAWRGKIRIQKDLMPSKQESVFLHEIIHEIDWQHGLKLEENKIETLGEMLYQVLEDNNLVK
jgi:hypothetical protein